MQEITENFLKSIKTVAAKSLQHHVDSWLSSGEKSLSQLREILSQLIESLEDSKSIPLQKSIKELIDWADIDVFLAPNFWLDSTAIKDQKYPQFTAYSNQQFVPAFSEFVLAQWQISMQKTAVYFAHLQGLPHDFFPQLSPEKLQEHRQNIDKFLQENQAFTNRVSQDFESFFREFSADFSEQVQNCEDTQKLTSKIDGKKQESTRKKFLQNQEEIHTAWRAHWDGEMQLWRLRFTINLLQSQNSLYCAKALVPIHKSVFHMIIPAFDSCKALIENSLHEFQRPEIHEKLELRREIIHQNKKLLHIFRDDKLPTILDAIFRLEINKNILRYPNRLRQGVSIFDKENQVIIYRDLEGLPPKSKFGDVATEAVIDQVLFPEFLEGYGSFSSEFRQQLRTLLTEISKIDEIIEFTLDTAFNLLRRPPKDEETDTVSEAFKTLDNGLNRTMTQINHLTEICKSMEDGARQELTQLSENFNKKLQQLSMMDDEILSNLTQQLNQAKTKEKLSQYQEKATHSFSEARKALIDAVKKKYKWLFRFSNQRLRRIKKATGLAPKTTYVEDTITEFLTTIQRQIDNLPYVYQHLFRIAPIQDERFIVGRGDEISQVLSNFNAWQEGKYVASVLVGEMGSGMTTLVKSIKSHLKTDLPISELRFSGTVYTQDQLFTHLKKAFSADDVLELDELEERIITSSPQRIVIVEGLHDFFLKVVGGFDTVQRFLLFVSRTFSNVYWITTCSLYSWEYLNKVINISKYFSSVTYLKPFSQKEIRQSILKRHGASGYQLKFTVPEDVASSRKYLKLNSDAERQEYLTDMLFTRLNSFAEGNIMVAILFWLRSIQKVEKEAVILSPQINFDHTFLYYLPDEELFAMTAILQHNTLGDDEFGKIFHKDKERSLQLLTRMKNRGILVKHPDGEFGIHPFLYRPIVQTLKTKNILH